MRGRGGVGAVATVDAVVAQALHVLAPRKRSIKGIKCTKHKSCQKTPKLFSGFPSWSLENIYLEYNASFSPSLLVRFLS